MKTEFFARMEGAEFDSCSTILVFFVYAQGRIVTETSSCIIYRLGGIFYDFCLKLPLNLLTS